MLVLALAVLAASGCVDPPPAVVNDPHLEVKFLTEGVPLHNRSGEQVQIFKVITAGTVASSGCFGLLVEPGASAFCKYSPRPEDAQQMQAILSVEVDGKRWKWLYYGKRYHDPTTR